MRLFFSRYRLQMQGAKYCSGDRMHHCMFINRAQKNVRELSNNDPRRHCKKWKKRKELQHQFLLSLCFETCICGPSLGTSVMQFYRSLKHGERRLFQYSTEMWTRALRRCSKKARYKYGRIWSTPLTSQFCLTLPRPRLACRPWCFL